MVTPVIPRNTEVIFHRQSQLQARSCDTFYGTENHPSQPLAKFEDPYIRFKNLFCFYAYDRGKCNIICVVWVCLYVGWVCVNRNETTTEHFLRMSLVCHTLRTYIKMGKINNIIQERVRL